MRPVPCCIGRKTPFAKQGFEDRIQLICGRFQDLQLDQPADAVISNSLVHHVPNAFQFWYALKTLAKPGAPVLIMDLLRPDTPEEAQALVDQYAADEPETTAPRFLSLLIERLHRRRNRGPDGGNEFKPPSDRRARRSALARVRSRVLAARITVVFE